MVCGEREASRSQLTRATVTFVILTSFPSAVVLVVLGTMLWVGLASGPHQTALTILPALVAMGSSPSRGGPGTLLGGRHPPGAGGCVHGACTGRSPP